PWDESPGWQAASLRLEWGRVTEEPARGVRDLRMRPDCHTTREFDPRDDRGSSCRSRARSARGPAHSAARPSVRAGVVAAVGPAIPSPGLGVKPSRAKSRILDRRSLILFRASNFTPDLKS